MGMIETYLMIQIILIEKPKEKISLAMIQTNFERG